MITKQITLCGYKISINTNTYAHRCTSSLIIESEGTKILCALTALKKPGSFSVNYSERPFASRESLSGKRIKEKEILVSRTIDRGLRPILPRDLSIQINCLVIENSEKVPVDFLSLIGAAGALYLAHLISEEFVCFLMKNEEGAPFFRFVNTLYKSKLLMIEGNAQQMTKEEFVNVLSKTYEIEEKNSSDYFKYLSSFRNHNTHVETRSKNIREYVEQIYEDLHQKNLLNYFLLDQCSDLLLFIEDFCNDNEISLELRKDIENDLRNKHIIETRTRNDKRALDEYRTLIVEKFSHTKAASSLLCSRGKTTTLGFLFMGGDNNDGFSFLDETVYNKILLNYAFLPFSVEEQGKINQNPSRRELGHSKIGSNSLAMIMDPTCKQYVRIFSEVLSAHASSSLLTATMGSLLLKMSNLPIKSLCAGVSMGIASYNNKIEILTDINELEDFSGYCDFKIVGTKTSILTIQLDVKEHIIDIQTLKKILSQAMRSLKKIIIGLESFEKSCDKHSFIESNNSFQTDYEIDSSKRGLIIGAAGKTIKQLQQEHKARMFFSDNILTIGSDCVEHVFNGQNAIYNMIDGKILGQSRFLAKLVCVEESTLEFISLNSVFHLKKKQELNNIKVGDFVLVKIKKQKKNNEYIFDYAKV